MSRDSLCDKLRSLRVRAHVPVDPKKTEPDQERFFIPDKCLEELITTDAVRNLLSDAQFRLDFYKRDELVKLIAEGGKKTLAILVLIQREKAILRFLEADQLQGQSLDSKLPLEQVKVGAILGDLTAAQDFCRIQWEFLVPIIRKDRSHRDFEHPETILPFLQCEKLGGGGFGDVFKVTLHQLHQQLVDLNSEWKAIVVLKTIRSRKHPSTESEEERILASLRSLQHPNIIVLLASFSLGGVHNLLFPLAQGDLEKLLQGEMPPPPNLCYEHAVLRECYGLSSAIESIHKYFVGDYGMTLIGCHYDLKPQNILVKDGKFILTDFGLSRLKPEEDWSQNEIPLRGYYFAPERESVVQEGFRMNSAGRSSDIWSFGCILAEVITYLRHAPKGVEAFRESRKFTRLVKGCPYTTKTFHQGEKLNPGVEDWLRKLDDNSTSNGERGALSLIRDLLRVDPASRPKIDLVADALFFLAQQALFVFSCNQTNELICQASARPRDTSPDSSYIALETESNRYKIWGRACGLAEQFPGTEGVRHVTISKSRHLHFEISDALRQIEDEIQFIHSWNQRSLVPNYFQLRSLIDKLWTYLPSHFVGQMELALESTMLDARSPGDLQNTADMFRNNTSPEYAKIGALAEVKYLATEDHAGDTERDDLLLQSSAISDESDFDIHRLGKCKLAEQDPPFPVLIEWMVYGPTITDSVSTRVRKIAALFRATDQVEQSGLRVLRCEAYYQKEDPPAFGLVYRIPMQEARPLTLRRLIKETARVRNSRPDLGDLFELATKIVRCVLQVHKVGWIHKSISSYNVLFFDQPGPGPILTSPYLIGFNHSREDAWQAFTEGLLPEVVFKHRIYQHPEYIRKAHGFLPVYDFYSLGVVLLEIGRWRTLDRLIDSKQRTCPEDIQNHLFEVCKKHLGHEMGAHYRDAVKACLASDFIFDRGGDALRNDFEEKVLNRLMKCRA
ncbi:kinase-like domain-containing protein [Sphaerosporella brunnea]|uniref:Kinase-like domain-containing protein n=1 Tax=Sphaerosporella brunnea TaxID=1250544 RepID=A0A5J5ELF5_9PEZI|nr:kinase-like domain-containing protein [Sphaerosporella brunnea]